MANLLTIAGLGALALATAACGPGEPSAPRPAAGAPPAVSPAEPAIPPVGAAPSVPETGARPSSATPLVVTQTQVEAEQSAEMEACLGTGDAAKGVTPAMAACITTELQAQDARLNTAYQAAMARLDNAGQARLRADERIWIRQRDAECEAGATGGTIDRIEIPSCILNETIRRRLVLEGMMK